MVIEYVIRRPRHETSEIRKSVSGILGNSDSATAQQLRDERIVCQNHLIEMRHDMELREWIASVNMMHDLIGQRAAAICEQDMWEAGLGRPPARYAFVAFGAAEGRKLRCGAIRTTV